MKDIRYKKKEADEIEPFGDCKLERKKYADNLTQIILNYPKGFVLALNNKWGDGKTFFIERWKMQLKKEKFQTIYYNAWEDDYSGNALISIMAELKEDIEAPDKELLENLLSKGTSFLTGMAPKVLKMLAKKVAGEQGYDELAEYVGEQIGKPLNRLLDDYTKQKQTVKEFKEALETFASATGNGKPIVFFIDELDRCKPSYAVEVLEIIKHLFSVDNIVFVLSIDKTQLANSIRGYYGSDNLDGDEYLKRFIDFEYSLPQPKLKEFNEYIYQKLNFSTSLAEDRFNYPILKVDNDSFVTFSNVFFEEKNMSLRKVERLMTQVRIAMYSFNSNEFMMPTVLLIMIYLKSEQETDYQRIKNKTMTLEEVLGLNKNLTHVTINLNIDKIPYEVKVNEYYLYLLYANYIGENIYSNGLKETEPEFIKKFTPFSHDVKNLYEFLKIENSRDQINQVSLNHLLTKIELSQNLTGLQPPLKFNF